MLDGSAKRTGAAGPDEARALLAESVVARGRATVTAADARAVTAGIDVLAEGGSAFDAAIAAGLVEAVALPMLCGLAGDVVAMIRNADGSFEVLRSVGPGAGALDRGAKLSVTGPCAVGVPGAPHGYAMLAARGKLPLRRLAQPAIALSRGGIEWTRLAAGYTRKAKDALLRHNSAVPYLPGNRVPEAGATVSNPGMADLIELFVETREELFFGEAGAQIARRVQEAGGFLAADDLRARPGVFSAPDVTQLDGTSSLLTTPAPTHGADLSRVVKMAAGQWHDARAVHAHFLSAQPARRDGGTSVVTACDEAGNAVVLVHSISFPTYGSGIVVEPWGLVLNNRPGRGFDTDAPADHPNAPKAGRVPKTTLHAWGLQIAGEIWLGATPGGQNQMPWNLQNICGLLAGERDLGRLVVSPLWGLGDKGGVDFEADHPLAAEADGVIPPLSHRSIEQIVHIKPGSAQRSAAADPRMGARAAALSQY